VGADGDVVHVPDADVQPIAAADVAVIIAAVATQPSADGVVEIAGPEAFAFEDAVARALAPAGDQRRVTADPEARYFGARVADGALLPGPAARIGQVYFADWLSRRRDAAPAA
jgi:uncharacterized protein YbjT (DUF2867 family)